MSSAICFNLDQSKILLSGKELSLCETLVAKSVEYRTLEQGSHNFFPCIDDNGCNWIHFSLTTDHCRHDVKKLTATWKKYVQSACKRKTSRGPFY